MLKALLKKQFMELGSAYIQNRKTGKRRSRGGIIGMLVLYAFLLIYLGVMFYSAASMFASALIPMGLTWLYFAMMAILSCFLGVFGSVFNTYAGLYHAKDNESLLSMPIPPSLILTARMTGVYALGTLFEAVVMIPAIVAYFVYGRPGILSVIQSVLLIPILGFLILALSCLLGWVVALIAGKLKNKSMLTVLISLVLLGGYYFLCMNSYSVIQSLLANVEQLRVTVRSRVYPLYLMGQGAAGDPLAMLLFTLMVLALLALTVWILSRTFLGIALHKENETKKEYKAEKAFRSVSVDRALLGKEWKRFSSSATYMLNCALGTVMMPAAGIVFLIFSDRIRAALDKIPISGSLLCVLAAAGGLMIASMNDITAPSISLEGRSLWQLQSLPVKPEQVLEAKQRLHWCLSIPPTLFFVICLSIVFRPGVVNGILIGAVSILTVMLSGALGLVVNLKHPILEWTNETIPVKQSVGVLICLLGGWGFAGIFGIVGYFGTMILPSEAVLGIWCVVIAAVLIWMRRWLKTRGARIFMNLG